MVGDDAFSLSSDLPYVTRDIPGLGGKLRSQPEHFIVEEIPLYPPCGEGQHLYINIPKSGITTRDVQKRIAEVLGLEASNVGYAGMKDKYALATQTFSIPIGNLSGPIIDECLKASDLNRRSRLTGRNLTGTSSSRGIFSGTDSP